MRTITIRQLSVNLFKELEDLPVTVTRYGKPYCVITPSVGVGDVSVGPISGESQDSPTGDVTPPERIKGVKKGSELLKPFARPRGDLDPDNYV